MGTGASSRLSRAKTRDDDRGTGASATKQSLSERENVELVHVYIRGMRFSASFMYMGGASGLGHPYRGGT